MSVSSDYFFYADVNYVDTSNVLSNYMNLTHNTNNSLDLSENILSKYARGIFFSPNYNKQFFDAINWANNLGDYKTQLNLINPFNNNVLENLQFDSTIIFTGGIFENGFDKNYTSNVDDIFNPFDLNEPGTISPPVYNYNGNFNNANIFSVSNSSLNEWNGWQPDKDWAISFIVKAPTTNTSCHLMHFGDPNNNNKYATVVWDFYNTNNPDTMRWGVSWTSDSNTGRVDTNHLGVVVYPYNLPSNTAYFQLLITYDKRDYTPNGDPNKTGPRIRYKENGRDSDYGLAIFWRGSNDITMFNSEHSDLPWDLSGFPDNIQSGHTWYATIKENETFNWTQTMTATIGGGPTGIVTHPDHGRHSNRGNIDESGYITDVKFWNTNIDPINQSQYIYSPPSNAIITANDNPTSGPNAGTQVPISLNNDNIEFRNAIAGNTIIPINNVLNFQSSFNYNQLGTNIIGEYASDNFGYYISLNSDGTRVAIGAKSNYGAGYRAGHVRVYDYVETRNPQWDQMGTDIDGIPSSQSGWSVSLNADGNILAVGSPRSSNKTGHFNIYEWINGSWQDLRPPIPGTEINSFYGYSIAISDNGMIVATGAYQHGSTNKGQVRIHEWDGNSWKQLGSDINGEADYDQSGWSVSLSSDGKIVAIGAIYNDGDTGSDRGHVRVYDYVEGRNPEWDQLGADIDGEAPGDNMGNSVSLSSNGKILAIGAHNNDVDSGNNRGHVRVYDYVEGRNPEWDQLGTDIEGGTNDKDFFGFSVSLNSDGTLLAVGATMQYTGNGFVNVYQYSNNDWNKVISNIEGEASQDAFGYVVSLNSNGTVLAVSSPYDDNNNGTDCGTVKIYGIVSTSNLSWKTPGTYYMRYKATDYDGVETPNNDEHYLTVTVNQGPVIYQSWKISDVTSNSITIPVHGPWMPHKDVYVKVTPVNAGNKFRLRFQGSSSGGYMLKDIRIAKMYIHGTQPHTLSPWYTISINGISGQTFFQFPQNDHQWTDWIDAPIEANTPYLVYFKYHGSYDWYTYWTTSTTNSWVNGTGENRVYNIDLMEVEN